MRLRSALGLACLLGLGATEVPPPDPIAEQSIARYEQIVRAGCERAIACDNAPRGALSTCVRTRRDPRMIARLRAGLRVISEARARAELRALARRDCYEAYGARPSSFVALDGLDVVGPRSTVGEPCLDDDDCTSGRCVDRGSDVAGVCRPRLSLGEACDQPEECAPRLTCAEGDTGRDGKRTCRPRFAPGARCEVPASYVDDVFTRCFDGWRCATENEVARCERKPDPERRVGLGQPCRQDMSGYPKPHCAWPLTCSDGGRCVSTQSRRVGERCGPQHECAWAELVACGDAGRCQRVHEPGTACPEGDAHDGYPITPYVYCDAGVHAITRDLGAPCTSDWACSSVRCRDGACAGPYDDADSTLVARIAADRQR